MASILMVDLAKSYGGAEVRVIETARILQEDSTCAVAVIANSPMHKKLLARQVKVFALPYKRFDPRLVFAISALVKEHGIQVVDTHNPQSNLWGMIAANLSKHAALVTTVHSSEGNNVPTSKTKFYDFILRINHWKGANFIAVSQSVYDYLVKLGISENKITLIKNGLTPPSDSSQNEIVSDAIRKQFGWSSNHFVVAIVGRLEPVKGHRYLLHALPSLVSKHTHLRCLFVGAGREMPNLIKLSHDLGLTNYVQFAGFQEDVGRILKESDAFCMPSLSEGLPFALLEACMHKVPVLATSVGGIKEILESDKSAILVPSMDVEALASGLDRLIKNQGQAKIMAQHAYRVVTDQYSLDETVKATLAVYDTVVN